MPCSPYFGQFAAVHRTNALIAQAIHNHLGVGLYISCHCIQFEVWAAVVWVYIPGRRPRFVSRAALGV